MSSTHLARLIPAQHEAISSDTSSLASEGSGRIKATYAELLGDVQSMVGPESTLSPDECQRLESIILFANISIAKGAHRGADSDKNSTIASFQAKLKTIQSVPDVAQEAGRTGEDLASLKSSFIAETDTFTNSAKDLIARR